MVGTATTISVNGTQYKVHVHKDDQGTWTATGQCEGIEVQVTAAHALAAVNDWRERARMIGAHRPR